MRFDITQCDTMPENALVYPIDFATTPDGRRVAPTVNISMTIRYGTDSLRTDYIYLLDTGTPQGFVITDPPQELDQFVSRIPHWKIEDLFSAKIRSRRLYDFDVDIMMPDRTFGKIKCGFDIGLRSFAEELDRFLPERKKPIVGTIGMRILKHYNMIIDLKNARLILTPTNRDFPSKRQSGTGFWVDSSGVVNRIRTNDRAYRQGLRIGDTVTSVNNLGWLELSVRERDSMLYMQETESVWRVKNRIGQTLTVR